MQEKAHEPATRSNGEEGPARARSGADDYWIIDDSQDTGFSTPGGDSEGKSELGSVLRGRNLRALAITIGKGAFAQRGTCATERVQVLKKRAPA